MRSPIIPKQAGLSSKSAGPQAGASREGITGLGEQTLWWMAWRMGGEGVLPLHLCLGQQPRQYPWEVGDGHILRDGPTLLDRCHDPSLIGLRIPQPSSIEDVPKGWKKIRCTLYFIQTDKCIIHGLKVEFRVGELAKVEGALEVQIAGLV